MSFFKRLFGIGPDPKDALRPLWHTVVGEARQPEWYARYGVADTLEGRFDMITAIMALVILRMDRTPELTAKTAYLTELFVEDMDGQLRQSGLGDPTVGKYIGKLVSAMGGRIGGFREGLSDEGRSMGDVVAANMTLTDGADADALGARLAKTHDGLAAVSDEELLAGRLAP